MSGMESLTPASGRGVLPLGRTPGPSGVLAKRAERPVETAEGAGGDVTPAAKRSALVPASGGEEVHALQAQVYALRQRCDDMQAEAQEDANSAALNLLREQQLREQLEKQREFLQTEKGRLKAQLAEVRQQCDAEHAARLEERRAASERLEAACDELRRAADEERERTRSEMRRVEDDAAAAVERVRAAGAGGASGAVGGDASGTSAGTVAAAAARRELAEAQSTIDALRAQLSGAERRVASAADGESTLASARQEIRRLEAQLAAYQSTPSVTAASALAGGGGGGSAGAAADMDQLRRQLAAAETVREAHASLAERHASAVTMLNEWCTLFATEAAACRRDGEDGAMARPAQSADGLPSPGVAAAVKTALAALRERCRAVEDQLASAISQAHAASSEAAVANREAAAAAAAAASAKEGMAAAEEKALRLEWQVRPRGRRTALPACCVGSPRGRHIAYRRCASHRSPTAHRQLTDSPPPAPALGAGCAGDAAGGDAYQRQGLPRSAPGGSRAMA